MLNQFFKWTYKKPKKASRKRHVYERVKQFIEIINVNFFETIYPTVLKKYFSQYTSHPSENTNFNLNIAAVCVSNEDRSINLELNNKIYV